MHKYIFLLACSVLVLMSCTKADSTPAGNPDQILSAAAVLQKKGSFVNGPYGRASGNASLFLKEGRHQVVLDDFTSVNGPDLKVYLSKEISPVNFVNLGSLKSITGYQIYDVPQTTNAQEYTHVLIYCKQYSHLFGWAELK